MNTAPEFLGEGAGGASAAPLLPRSPSLPATPVPLSPPSPHPMPINRSTRLTASVILKERLVNPPPAPLLPRIRSPLGRQAPVDWVGGVELEWRRGEERGEETHARACEPLSACRRRASKDWAVVSDLVGERMCVCVCVWGGSCAVPVVG